MGMAVDPPCRFDLGVGRGQPLTNPASPGPALLPALAAPAAPVVFPSAPGAAAVASPDPPQEKPQPLLGRGAAPPPATPVSASRELDPVVRPPVDVPVRPRPCRDTISSSRPAFSVAISRALGTIVVTVHGVLDDRAGELRRTLGDLIGQHQNQDVVVDLRDMTVADGTHLKLFMDASNHAREAGGHLALSGPGHATAAALARAGLTEVLDVEPSGAHRPLYRPGS